MIPKHTLLPRLAALAVVAAMLPACAPAYVETAPAPGEVGDARVLLDGGFDRDFRFWWGDEARAYSVHGDSNRVWALIQRVYRELEIAPNQHNSRDRLIGVQGLPVDEYVAGHRLPSLVDCGSGAAGPYALTREVRLDVLAHVRPTRDDGGTGSVLELLVSGHAAERTTSSNYVRCVSRGVLERYIAERIVELLALPSTATSSDAGAVI